MLRARNDFVFGERKRRNEQMKWQKYNKTQLKKHNAGSALDSNSNLSLAFVKSWFSNISALCPICSRHNARVSLFCKKNNNRSVKLEILAHRILC